jgi:dsDNA-specific endonuclease/ATPase MutS2
MLEIEERVNHLDELMARLIQTVDRTSKEMRRSYERSQRDMQDFRDEMHDFKEEMRQSRESSEREMHDFKVEMRQSRESSEREMHDFKVEMRQSHERFEQEMRQSRRDLDKKWGELSNKLGSMAEDLVAPSIPRILKQLTGCTAEIEYSAVRVRKSKPQNQEFDVVVKCENWVFINETKSNLRPEHLEKFHRLMQKIRDYFPEYKENQFIGAIASLYVDQSLVEYGETLGLVVLGFGEELMDVLNSAKYTLKLF